MDIKKYIHVKKNIIVKKIFISKKKAEIVEKNVNRISS